MKPKLSIIGSGDIGGNLARLLIKAGYEVALSNSRGPASLQDFVVELGSRLHAMEVGQVIEYGEIVIVSPHWRNLDAMPVFDVSGKIVVDTTNPYKQDGSFFDLKGDISSSKVLQHFTGGKLVKAFNTIWFRHLADDGNSALPLDERRVIPIAGDDPDAKKAVATLIEAIGFAPLDTGNLLQGSALQGVDGVLYGKELSLVQARNLLASR
jgi:predicted dinucleotide-binding enzyme